MSTDTSIDRNNATLGIGFILLGMAAISVNDMLIKELSGGYPLHQMVFVRSAIGIGFSLALVWYEGGLRILRTATPGLHLLRGLLVVVANMAYFTALAVMPLANATALFFVAPLFITVLSIPFLGERVGIRRLSAVVVGFAGVLIILQPEIGGGDGERPAAWVLVMPVLAALAYALMQILTRKLGITSKASAMAVYIQGTFLLVSAGFWVVAGDGRYAEGLDDPSLIFLLREWRWPEAGDLWLFVVLGLLSAVVGYSLSQAYRSADAGVVAPFEYVALPLAALWGWLMWNELPGPQTTVGIAVIMGAGLYVFLRERVRQRPLAVRRPIRRY